MTALKVSMRSTSICEAFMGKTDFRRVSRCSGLIFCLASASVCRLAWV